ncbi:MAG TPA: hypothetical protein VGW40_16020 [Allosphingosinicella sp.]|nr:hypothetical protein [Allosphingosinicella sp.]
MLAVGCSAAAAERPLFRAGSEQAVPGEMRPALPLIRFVLNALDREDARTLAECIAENGLGAGDYGALLRAVRIGAGPGRRLWFVRPSHGPLWCHALYGAHLFRYFLVEERLGRTSRRYRLVFRNGGDFFAVYPRLHHGLNDIETTGCNAFKCWIVRLAYDGRRYRPIRCSRTDWRRDGTTVTRPIRCDTLN